MALSIVYPNFCTNIAVMKTGGGGLHEVTDGDAAGRYTRLGPAAIQLLDLDSGDLSTLAEEPEADLLGPRLAADGTLFYIRRPYETGPVRVSPLGLLKDTVLFPFRMSYAIFQFFSFFSMRYSGKPLTSSKGGVQRQPDLKQMMIWGNLLDADKAARGADRSDAEAPSMLPASWQLIRRAGGTSNRKPEGSLSQASLSMWLGLVK